MSLAVVLLVILIVNEFVGRTVIAPQISAMQRSAEMRDTTAVKQSLENEIVHFAELTRHLAKDAGAGEGIDWADESIAWACIVDAGQPPRWLCGSELAGEPSIDQVLLNASEPGKSNTTGQSSRTAKGIVRTNDQSLMMFASAEIPSSQSIAGQPKLIVGRPMDKSVLSSIRNQTQVDFVIRAPDADSNFNRIEIRVPRQIIDRADQAFVVTRYLFVLGIVAALLSLLLLLQRIVISPLDSIREHLDRIAIGGLKTQPLSLTCNDEIGDLSRAFDKMVVRLSETQRQLSDASQASGRSEVAANVIHNVGNVLTNVNSLIDTASERVEGLRFETLQRLAQQLTNKECVDGLLDATPGYLTGLAEKWKSDQETLAEMLATLDDNVRHIHDVIRDQQRHADRSIESKPIDLGDLIDEAIGCCRARLSEESIEVRVDRDPDVVVLGDRSLMLQTLINIIGNARRAMREAEKRPSVLLIVASRQGGISQLEFRDNGCGMTPETLARVFEAHFTLHDGGTGLGLHFCANTIKRFGGSIQARSAGLGLGSTITIQLPSVKRGKLYDGDRANLDHFAEKHTS